jgi:hypothetical protein
LGSALAAAASLAAALLAGHTRPVTALARAAEDVGLVDAVPAASGGGRAPTAGDAFIPDLGVPATSVVAFGASPGESPTEAWAYGKVNGSEANALLEHVASGAWRVMPLPPGREGGSLGSVELGLLGGQATFGGGVVLVTEGGIVVRDPGGQPQLVPSPEAIDAGGSGSKTKEGSSSGGGSSPGSGSSGGGSPPGGGSSGGGSPPGGGSSGNGSPPGSGSPGNGSPPGSGSPESGSSSGSGSPGSSESPQESSGSKGVLGSGESLPPSSAPGGASTAYAVIEEGDGRTGVLIAPYDDGSGAPGPGILHYDGLRWTREPIALPSETQTGSTGDAGLTPEALACGGTSAGPSSSAPQNCWLLAGYESEPTAGKLDRLALFRRVPSVDPSGYTWRQVQVVDPSGLLGTPSGATGQATARPLGQGAQMLTATVEGVWVDFQTKVGEVESQVSEFVDQTASSTEPQISVQSSASSASSASSTSSSLPSPSSATTTSSTTTTSSSSSSSSTTTTTSSTSSTSSSASSPGKTATASEPALQARVAGTWCYPTGAVCSQTLAAPLPSQYRSFAWPGASPGDLGTRIITGLPGRAMLEFSSGSFLETPGAPSGSVPGSVPGGAAFSSPRQGWIADGADRAAGGFELVEGADRAGQSQVIEATANPSGPELQEESVPFRHPLLALAQMPGSTPGDPGAQALAVGVEGQVGRYLPGQGWRSESLYSSAGKVKTPTLRGVAWPEPSRAYAVGDNGEMWLWRAETGLWEPDPAKPFDFIGNLTAIAFSASDPELGYAVGKQGALLKYGKSWEQISANERERLEGELNTEEQSLDFTSVTFAGNEALATYRMVQGEAEVGGIIVEDGTGWHVEKNIPQIGAGVLSKIDGLSDGGVVAAGPGEVIERDSPNGQWRFSSEPPPLTQNVSALAAYRDPAGSVRAVISVDLNQLLNPNAIVERPFRFSSWGLLDSPPPTGPGQPPFFVEPDPLPSTGYVLKETAEGWIDMEHAALPAIEGVAVDQPVRPDPVLALVVNPSGASGLAVGGQTGDFEASPSVSSANVFYQTGAAMRFPVSAASANGASPAPVATVAGHASFVVAGQAACVSVCLANEGLGPDVWLTHALRSANQIAAGSPGGLRAFLYTGSSGGADVFTGDLAEYNESLPLYASGSTSSAPGAAPAYYSFVSSGASGGPVRVIMLDYSTGALGTPQEEWLVRELNGAREERTPAIVVGNASLGFQLPDGFSIGNQAVREATDAAVVSSILVQGEASAYFFDYPGNNVKTEVRYGSASIPAYGSGTIGYVTPAQNGRADQLGSSGFLLADVDTAAHSSCPPGPAPCSNVVPVTAQIVPNIGQLSMDATDGVLLRRSKVALFEALARRPPGGIAILASSNDRTLLGPDPYDQIPFNCQGANCAYEVPTDYTFSSSNPDIGDFVAHEPGSENPRQVLLGANELPVLDPHSGLFCAFNAGTTTVSITTGGLTYSEPVTVQAGSVEYPCGTVPLRNPPLAESTQLTGFPSVPLAGASPPQVNPQIQTIAPPPPPPALVSPRPHPAHPHPAALIPFLPLAPPAIAARAVIVPPPPPPVARPIPPSGTSQVYQSAVAPQDEREEESATSVVGVSEFSAYHADEHGGPGPWLLLLVVIAAGAGTGIRSGMRSRARGRPAYARAHSRARSYKR